MRGTDPTKSKWECPIMFYVCFRHKPTDVSLNKILGISRLRLKAKGWKTNGLFVCNSR